MPAKAANGISGHEDVRAYEVPMTLIGGGATALLDCAAMRRNLKPALTFGQAARSSLVCSNTCSGLCRARRVL
jgi:hypothetical protein